MTYADATETNIVDVKVITNSGITSSGNISTTVMTRYSGATVNGDKITATGDPTDRETINNTSFDKFGNALTQTVLKESYSNGVFTFGSYQSIMNNVYDVHNRLTYSNVQNYSDKGTTLIDAEAIWFSNFDAFGNAKNEVVNSYTKLGGTFIDSKVITNSYSNIIAESRGNPSSTTVSRYTTDVTANQNNSTLIDQVVTNTSSFDAKGNALTQTQDKYAYNTVTSSLGLVSEYIINNSNFTARGDAQNQTILVKGTDSNGTLTTLSYEEVTNRAFDAQHNATDKRVSVYTDSTKSTPVQCAGDKKHRI